MASENGTRIALLVLLIAFAAFAQPTAYRLTELGTLGGASSRASALNNSGQVVGTSETVLGTSEAFLYSNGQMVTLGTLPGSTDSQAFAINDSGLVVGNSRQAFLYTDGILQDIGSALGGQHSYPNAINAAGDVLLYAGGPGNPRFFLLSSGAYTEVNELFPEDLRTNWITQGAYDINDRGQILGNGAHLSSGEMHGFLVSGSRLTDLGRFSYPTAINNHGQAAGGSWLTNAMVATLWDGTNTSYLPLPSGIADPSSPQALDINSAGHIVGSSYPGLSMGVALLWYKGRAYDLNSLIVGRNTAACTLWEAVAVNEAGQIAANLSYPSYGRAVLLTPVPLIHYELDLLRQELILHFWTMTNHVYTVQTSADLVVWQDRTDLQGVNGQVAFAEPTTNTLGKFYRVLLR
jgi:probable HAF family extracellular repeat protein